MSLPPAIIPRQTLCPTCGDANPTPLIANMGGKIGYGCRAGHHFTDLRQLRGMNLRSTGPTRKAIGDKYELPVLPAVLQQLENRFGERMGATIEAVLTALSIPGSFLVGGHELVEISQQMGGQIRGTQDLLAVAKDLRRQVGEAEGRVKESMDRSNGIQLRLPRDVESYLKQIADSRGISIAEVIEGGLPTAIKAGAF